MHVKKLGKALMVLAIVGAMGVAALALSGRSEYAGTILAVLVLAGGTLELVALVVAGERSEPEPVSVTEFVQRFERATGSRAVGPLGAHDVTVPLPVIDRADDGPHVGPLGKMLAADARARATGH